MTDETNDRFLKMANKLHEVRRDMHDGVVLRDQFKEAVGNLDKVIIFLAMSSMVESKKGEVK